MISARVVEFRYTVSICKQAPRLITKGCHEAHSRRAGDDVIGSMRSSSPSSLRPESAAGRTKLLHDLFRSVIASVSSCRPGAAHPIHPASRPARAASWYRPEAAVRKLSPSSVRIYVQKSNFLRRKIYEGRENTTGRCFSTNNKPYIANAKLYAAVFAPKHVNTAM